MLAVDLPGHGLTRSQGRGTGVPAMHALLHRFIEAVPVGPVILAGNSMGGMISLLEASTAPAAVAGVVECVRYFVRGAFPCPVPGVYP